jgi:hypothetical protein
LQEPIQATRRAVTWARAPIRGKALPRFQQRVLPSTQHVRDFLQAYFAAASSDCW